MYAPIDLARSALDSAPDAMVITDEQGIIRHANRQVTVLFGFPHEQIVGERIEILLPERFRARHLAHRQSYMSSVRVRPMGVGLDLFGLRQDGSEFPVEISLSPIEQGERVLVAAAIRDVTDRKHVEAELIVARQSAERARESADRANQAKSRFLATASHDLRQPLQTLSLLNGVLRRSIVETDAQEVLGQQDQAIGAMARLLNALLDISKLESGAVTPDVTDFTVRSLFEELRVEFSSLAASKGLTFNVISSEDSVHSDRSLVEQILKNLLSNAIKYTRQGWVALRCLREPSSVRIEVLDTGVGIPQDQQRYIYDEFYQIDVPTNRAREGYGLGLSIVRRLVTLLDLKLEVHSEVGKGSLFALSLPVGHAVAGATALERGQLAPRATRGAAHILLVEDDASVRDATRMLLKGEGYKVTAVASLAEALAQASRDAAPELIVTDYHLKDGETGMQVIVALREKLGVPLGAVLITGDTSAAVHELRLDAKLRLASKPMKAEELLGTVRTLLNA